MDTVYFDKYEQIDKLALQEEHEWQF